MEAARGQPLHARRPLRMREPALDRARAQRLAEDEARCGDGIAGIVDLVASVEPWQRQVEQPLGRLEDQPPMLLEGIEVAPGHVKRRAKLFRLPPDDSESFALLPAHNARHARLDDAGLLAGNLGQCLAKEGDVVDRDRRDGREQRLRHDIGRVEPSPQARLEQQKIGWRLGEGEKCRRRRDLEQRDQLSVIGGLRAGEAIDQYLLADGTGA